MVKIVRNDWVIMVCDNSDSVDFSFVIDNFT